MYVCMHIWLFHEYLTLFFMSGDIINLSLLKFCHLPWQSDDVSPLQIAKLFNEWKPLQYFVYIFGFYFF